MYCVEGTDNNGSAWNFIMPGNEQFKVMYKPDVLGGTNSIGFDATAITIGGDGKQISTTSKHITAIPYYSWSNRGSNEMQVWLPTSFKAVRINE